MRKRFKYILPVAGAVCRDVYAPAFGLSVQTIMRSLKLIDSVVFFESGHAQVENKNVATIDLKWLTKWFKVFAALVGEIVPLRFPKQQRVMLPSVTFRTPMLS
jgi:hypothetical protein